MPAASPSTAQRRKIRVLIAKVGLDGHDVGARVVARGLLDAGMEVIYTGLRRTTEEVARAAIEEDVDWIGVSILSGAHQTLLPKLRRLLDEAGAEDIRIIAGGIIPQEDIPQLQAQGVARVFLSGTSIAEIVGYLVRESASDAIAPARATP
jgi:methylmalonyl-CoA mutase C-terminal domain/subunit